jgi:hypothetical protein
MKSKRAANARREAWLENAEEFAGVASRQLAMGLWDQRLWLALPSLVSIANHWEKVDGIRSSLRWKSESFRKTAATFVRRGDLITRLYLRMLRSVKLDPSLLG